MSRLFFYKRACQFNEWIKSPIRNKYGTIIEERWWFIEEFIKDGLEIFLLENGFSLGKNIDKFKKNFAYWWFLQEQAYKKNKYVSYPIPLHRNHKYDLEKFFDTFDSENTDVFLQKWGCEGFCDDSSIGDIISSEIKYFIYCYIDIVSCTSIREVDLILQEEEESRLYREKMIKMGGVHNNNARHDYDASELGYFKGDRIMST